MIIRKENKKDWKEVENLVRESFWNKYRPGCYEHFVLHNARDCNEFIDDLNYVIQDNDGKVIGQIMYCKASIVKKDNTKKDVIVFGPVSVLPEMQKKGYGEMLINYTLQIAKNLGYHGVIITGNPDYYHKFGFESCSNFGICYEGLNPNDDAPYFMGLNLTEGYLEESSGVFIEPKCYSVNFEKLDEYDKEFPQKKKEKLPGQFE